MDIIMFLKIQGYSFRTTETDAGRSPGKGGLRTGRPHPRRIEQKKLDVADGYQLSAISLYFTEQVVKIQADFAPPKQGAFCFFVASLQCNDFFLP